MYRILNKLFGWDYVYWTNSWDHGIARIHTTPDGMTWYWRYKITSLIDVIVQPSDVMWLTCKASKYFPQAKDAK